MADDDNRPKFRGWPKTAQAHNVVKSAHKMVKNAQEMEAAGTDMETLPYSVAVPDLRRKPDLEYKSKVKLHGTNAGICGWVPTDGEGGSVVGPEGVGVVGMSRKRFLWAESQDNDGFRDTWLAKTTPFWQAFFGSLPPAMGLDPEGSAPLAQGEGVPANSADGFRRVEVFGEWAGAGIQKATTAVCQIPHHLYAIFALRFQAANGRRYIVAEPDTLQGFLDAAAEASGIAIPDEVRVLPWHVPDEEVASRVAEEVAAMPDMVNAEGQEAGRAFLASGVMVVDLNSKIATRSALAVLSSLVETIDDVDPWCKSEFGIEGNGEGLVLYPVSLQVAPGETPGCEFPHFHSQTIASYFFKAKGKSHRGTLTSAAATFEITSFGSAQEMVGYFVTVPRLYQGRATVADNTFDPEHQDAFVDWFVHDILTESADERAANPDIDETFFLKLVRERATEWYASEGATMHKPQKKGGRKGRRKKK